MSGSNPSPLAFLLVALAVAPSRSGELVIQQCEQVEVNLEDSRQEEMGHGIAGVFCHRFKALGSFFGSAGKDPVRVTICADMESFRKRTGRPWYIGAALVGEQIVTQPARSLRRLDNLEATLAHELIHLMVLRAAGRNCPRWLDEGLAQWLAGRSTAPIDGQDNARPWDEEQLMQLERRLASMRVTAAQLQQDYRAALALVDRLIAQVGLETLINALPALKKVDDHLKLQLRGMSLRKILFGSVDGRKRP